MGKLRSAVTTGNCPRERGGVLGTLSLPSGGMALLLAVIRNMRISFHKLAICATPFAVGESDAHAHDGRQRKDSERALETTRRALETRRVFLT